jgi:hypothetical protein
MDDTKFNSLVPTWNYLLIFYFPILVQTKAYKEYVGSKKNVNLLTEEDKFLLQLGKVERISAKLSIMNYIGNFFDNIHLITPVSI